MRKILNLVQIFLVLNLVQCSHALLDVQKTYKKTLRFEIEGESISGVYSAKKKNSYDIEISTPQKPDFVKLTSCHQEKIFVKPGKSVEFTYKPDLDIEAGKLPCPLEISALETSGKNQWGLIDFKLVDETLNAKIKCNGEAFKAFGSHICQSRIGLIQSIEFESEVHSLSPKRCATIEPESGKKFYFSITEGNCFYLFSDSKGNQFRLVTFGYNEVLLDEYSNSYHYNSRSRDFDIFLSQQKSR